MLWQGNPAISAKVKNSDTAISPRAGVGGLKVMQLSILGWV
jgi:hypothetical protein